MTWSFNNTTLVLNQMNVTSIQELKARQARENEQAKEAFRNDPTFQRFTTQLLKARAKQRQPEVLKKPPGR